jgi:MFS family permease
MHIEQDLSANKPMVFALAASVLVASLGVSIATVALPTLGMVFSADVRQVQWVVLAYLLAVTVAIVLAGRLGDLYGQHRVLVAGLALFTLASAACAAAPGLGWLIAGRVVQGIGAAALMALPLPIAKGLVAQGRVGTAMGLLGTMSALGTAAGPALGGLLIGALGWRAAFVLLMLSGAITLAVALRCIPKASAARTDAGSVDWAGGSWLSIVLLCLALSATGGASGLAIQPWMSLAVAAAALVAFVHTERTAARPLVPLHMLRERPVATSLAMNLLVGAIMMSTLVVGPFFLSFGLGLSEAQTGLVMAVGPVVAALSGVPAGRATDRFGTHRTLMAGLLLTAAALCCFAVLSTRFRVPGYVGALVLMTPGFQLFLAANNTAVMTGTHDADKGLLSGLLGLSRNLGFMAGASLAPWTFAFMLDGHGVAGSSSQAIGEAFTGTFAAAAGLCVLAIVLALLGQGGRRGPSPQ